MSHFTDELASQPSLWPRAAAIGRADHRLQGAGQRVAFVGCGTSLYVAQAAARFRELQGLGPSDAFPASEMPATREYDMVVAISRSGTTSELLAALAALPDSSKVLAITADPAQPLAAMVADPVVLDFADEQSVVQTRFATCTLALLLGSFGWDVEASAARARALLAQPAPAAVEEARQFVFLGRAVAAAIANEAALKMREVLAAWTESYPTMEFRHGPISVLGEHSLVWILDDAEPSIDEQIEATGATLLRGAGDPLAELVGVHVVAAHLAELRGVDADNPRFLTRAVVLDGGR
jgi:fructoselysine-6-P-deglycase FrlB-like protein